MRGFMNHLVQRSLAATVAVRPRTLTPFEPDAMRAAFESGPTSQYPLPGSQCERHGDPTVKRDGVPTTHPGKPPAAAVPPSPREADSPPRVPPPAPLWREVVERPRFGGAQRDPAAGVAPADPHQGGPLTDLTLSVRPESPVIAKPMETRLSHGATAHRAAERVVDDPPASAVGTRIPRAARTAPQPIDEASADEPFARRRRGQHLTHETILQQPAAEAALRPAVADPPLSRPTDRGTPAPPRLDGETRQAATPHDRFTHPVASRPLRDTGRLAASDSQPLRVSHLPLFDAALQANSAAAEPIVHVTIGRVEIRAVAPAADTPAKRAAPAKPRLSLGDYLDRRGGGRR